MYCTIKQFLFIDTEIYNVILKQRQQFIGLDKSQNIDTASAQETNIDQKGKHNGSEDVYPSIAIENKKQEYDYDSQDTVF